MKNGYMEGNGFFYVALEDNHGHTVDITPAIMEKWSPNWSKISEHFERVLHDDDDLRVFSNKMFMVWDGNHCIEAWIP